MSVAARPLYIRRPIRPTINQPNLATAAADPSTGESENRSSFYFYISFFVLCRFCDLIHGSVRKAPRSDVGPACRRSRRAGGVGSRGASPQPHRGSGPSAGASLGGVTSHAAHRGGASHSRGAIVDTSSQRQRPVLRSGPFVAVRTIPSRLRRADYEPGLRSVAISS